MAKRSPCDGFEVSWDAKNPYFAKAYAHTAEHVDSITQKTQADVMRVIRTGYENGDGIPEVAAAIRDTIRGSSLGRAATIARTEMNRFQNGASLSAATVVSQQTGQGYWKRWLTAPGAEHPRHEDYDGLDGQTVPLGEMFDVGGEPFEYPGDPDGDPGDSINCRCSLIYVESEDAPDSAGQEADLGDLEGSVMVDDNISTVPGKKEPPPKQHEGPKEKPKKKQRKDPEQKPVNTDAAMANSRASATGAKKPVVAIDFDGVIHEQDDFTPGPIPGRPVPGAIDWLKQVAQEFEIVIFTARAHDIAEHQAVITWLNDNGFSGTPYTVTNVKPQTASLYIDDRGYRFDGPGSFPPLEEMMQLTHTWWMKDLPDPKGETAGVLADTLNSNAETMGDVVTPVIGSAVQDQGGTLEGLEHRFKEAPALAGKIGALADEKNLNIEVAANDVKDALRYTAVFDPGVYTDKVLATLDALRNSGFSVDRVRNYWEQDVSPSPRTSPGVFVGINVVLRARNGFPVEIQFHTPESYRINEEQNWALYRKIRTGEAEGAERDRLEAEMRANLAGIERPAGIDDFHYEPDGAFPHPDPLRAGAQPDADLHSNLMEEPMKPNTTSSASTVSVTFSELAPAGGESPAPADADECANCEHQYDMHGDDGGACTMDGCDCESFTAETTLTADGDPMDDLVPDEHTPQSVTPEANESPEPPDVVQRTNAAETPIHLILAPEGKATDDGRIFAPGSIGWRQLPLSLMAMTETPGEGGHAGAELCGRIDSIYRNENVSPVMIEGEGVCADTDYGHEIASLIEQGHLTGNSVDLAVNGSKIAYRADVVNDDGFWLNGVDIDEVEAVSILDIFFGLVDPGDVIFVITEAKIGMSTICPFPAFAEATVSLAADGSQRKWTIFQGIDSWREHVHVGESVTIRHTDANLTASAAGMAPAVPPSDWFKDPGLDELTPLTVTDDGRVYGHAWAWGECHIGIQDSCTIAPHSNANYGYFLLKEVECADGSTVEVGTVTLDTNHAGRGLGWKEAASHYDHTGTAIADVSFGEDEHGGWFAGCIRPDANADAVRKFQRGSVSGDWRRIHGNLELVGLLTVNVPGFPIPRAKALVASGEEGMEVLALIAAGVIQRDPSEPVEVSEANRAVLVAIASGEMNELLALAEALRQE